MSAENAQTVTVEPALSPYQSRVVKYVTRLMNKHGKGMSLADVQESADSAATKTEVKLAEAREVVKDLTEKARAQKRAASIIGSEIEKAEAAKEAEKAERAERKERKAAERKAAAKKAREEAKAAKEAEKAAAATDLDELANEVETELAEADEPEPETDEVEDEDEDADSE